VPGRRDLASEPFCFWKTPFCNRKTEPSAWDASTCWQGLLELGGAAACRAVASTSTFTSTWRDSPLMASAMKNVSHRQRLRDDLAALRYMALVPPHSRIRISEPSARLQALVKVLKAVQRKHHYSTAMGNSWQVPGEAAALERISTPAFGGPPIQTLCEIGFNAGHSAAALLLHNNATLHEFDTSMSQRGASNALGVVRIARRRCLPSPRHISPNHLQTSHISYDRSSRRELPQWHSNGRRHAWRSSNESFLVAWCSTRETRGGRVLLSLHASARGWSVRAMSSLSTDV
jgi:hypothetical protein